MLDDGVDINSRLVKHVVVVVVVVVVVDDDVFKKRHCFQRHKCVCFFKLF